MCIRDRAPLAAVAPWLSPNMAGAVSQALELQPDARFAGAAAMRAALLGTAAGGPRMAAGPLPSAARVTTVMPPPAPARQRFILPAALAGVALLVVVGFLAWRVLVDGSSGRGPTPPATAARGIVCLLYTSDAADERSSVDLGGRRIIKKKKTRYHKRTTLALYTACRIEQGRAQQTV